MAKPGRRAVAAAALASGIVALGIGLRLRDPAQSEALPAGPGNPPAAERQAPAAATPAAAPLEPGQSADLPVVDIFAPRDWQPPPPPAPPVEEVAPAPQAPPLPFRLVGRFIEDGQATVFLLAEGQRVFAVRVGDRIGERYRIEKIERGQLVFRYRPMNARQTLAVGDAQ